MVQHPAAQEDHPRLRGGDDGRARRPGVREAVHRKRDRAGILRLDHPEWRHGAGWPLRGEGNPYAYLERMLLRPEVRQYTKGAQPILYIAGGIPPGFPKRTYADKIGRA